MTAATLILLAAVAGTLLGYSLAQTTDYADRDLPGLVDVCTIAAPDLDRPAWLPHPHPFATGRFVAWQNPALRRLDTGLHSMRETARKRGPA